MRCSFGCTAAAIGIANVRGVKGRCTEGHEGTYKLCPYHYTEMIEGRWNTVELIGWEPLPTEEV